MTFSVDKSDPAIVAVDGDVLGGADAMEFSRAIAELIRDGKRKVVVDLEGVHIMNSSGLGMLVAASTSLRACDGNLVVAAANEKIRSLLKMTRLDGVVQNYASRGEAVAATQGN